MLRAFIIFSLVSLPAAADNCHFGGKMYKRGIGCYTCFCLNANSVLCTQNSCDFHPNPEKWVDGDDGCDFKGNMYKTNDVFTYECIVCTCGGFHAVFCTDMQCSPRPRFGVHPYEYECSYNGQMYREGDIFMRDCKKCVCLKNDAIYCEDTVCIPFVDTERVTLKDSCSYKGKLHKHGDIFLDFCNRCTCKGNDVLVCTRLSCGRNVLSPNNNRHVIGRNCEYKGSSYPRGETFVDGCNECYCSVQGTVDCLQISCRNYKRLVRTGDVCYYNGFYYSRKQSFIDDGCHECRCVGEYKLRCKLLLCHQLKDLKRVDSSGFYNIWRQHDKKRIGMKNPPPLSISQFL